MEEGEWDLLELIEASQVGNSSWIPITDKLYIKGTLAKDSKISVNRDGVQTAFTIDSFLLSLQDTLQSAPLLPQSDSQAQAQAEGRLGEFLGREEEVIEELTENDCRILESRGRRIAHTFLPTQSTSPKQSATNASTEIGREELGTKFEKLALNEPIRSKVIERPMARRKGPIPDPSYTITKNEIKESIFKRQMQNSLRKDEFNN